MYKLTRFVTVRSYRIVTSVSVRIYMKLHCVASIVMAIFLLHDLYIVITANTYNYISLIQLDVSFNCVGLVMSDIDRKK